MNFFKSILDFFNRSAKNSKSTKKRSTQSSKKTLKKPTLKNIPESPSKSTIAKEPRVSATKIVSSHTAANSIGIPPKLDTSINVETNNSINTKDYAETVNEVLSENRRLLVWMGSAQAVEFTVINASTRTRIKANITKIEQYGNEYFMFGNVIGTDLVTEFSSKKIATKILALETKKRLSIEQWVDWVRSLESSNVVVSKNDEALSVAENLQLYNDASSKKINAVADKSIKNIDANSATNADIQKTYVQNNQAKVVEDANNLNKKPLSPEIIDTIKDIINSDGVETKIKTSKSRVNEDNLETVD